MIKFLSLIFVFLFSTFAQAAGVNFADHIQVLDLKQIASIASSGSTSAIDLQGYQGPLAILLAAHNTAGSSPTLDVKIQDSADGVIFTDVSGATFTQVTTADSSQKLIINRGGGSLRRYVTPYLTIGGTNSPAYYVTVKGLAVKKYPQ